MFELFVILFLAIYSSVAVLLLVWVVFGVLFLVRRTKPPRNLIYLTVIAGTAAVAAYELSIRPAMLRARQVRSLADMQSIERWLEDYRKVNGHFPDNLGSALESSPYLYSRDGWGNPFFYESRGDGFILVSLGSDGKQDGSDYWQLRNANAPSTSVRGVWSADQVLSDNGWHREAGK